MYIPVPLLTASTSRTFATSSSNVDSEPKKVDVEVEVDVEVDVEPKRFLNRGLPFTAGRSLDQSER